MPQLKMGSKNVKPEATGFSIYEGPEPRDGVYNAVLHNMSMRKGQESGNLYFNMLVEFEDNEGEKVQYNGFSLWNRVVPGDSDLQQIRVAQLISAVCGRNEANVDFADVDGPDKGKVKKIGGKDPEGTKVKVSVRRKRDNRNKDDFVIEVQDMFPRSGGPSKGKAAADVDVDVDEVDTVDAEGGVDPDGVDLDELREELEALTLVKAKKYAKDNTELTDSDLKGKKLPEVVELILAQYADPDEEDEESAAEGDTLDELRDELNELDTAALKKRAKANGATLKDLKGLDDEALVELIFGQETGGSGDGEEPTEDEEGRWLYSYAETLDRDVLIAKLVEAGYDEDDFEDEEEYPSSSLVDTLVEEDLVAAQDATPF
jgi:hypothetical protein